MAQLELDRVVLHHGDVREHGRWRTDRVNGQVGVLVSCPDCGHISRLSWLAAVDEHGNVSPSLHCRGCGVESYLSLQA